MILKRLPICIALATSPAVFSEDVAKKETAPAKGSFLDLVPEDALLIASAPGLERLEKSIRGVMNQIPGADSSEIPEIGMLLAMALDKAAPPEGLDPARPIGVASDLTNLWFFLPAKDAKALKAWVGEDRGAYEADGYFVVPRQGAYKRPERSSLRAPLSGDLSASVRLSSLLARYAPMLESGISQMREFMVQDPAAKDALFILDAEIALVRAIAESIDQMDLALELSGPDIDTSFRAIPSKTGLSGRLVEAIAASPRTGSGGLGAFLPPGAMLELEWDLPLSALVALVDAIPWDKVGKPGETAKFGDTLKKLIQEQAALADGRAAVSYNFLDLAKMQFRGVTVNGVTNGPAYREFLKTVNARPEVKELMRAMNVTEYSWKYRSDAFKLEGVSVDEIEQEFKLAAPGLPLAGPEEGKFRMSSYSAIVGDVAIVTMGEGAREALGPVLRRKLANRPFQNMLSAMKPSDARLRGAFDVAAFLRSVAQAAPMGPGADLSERLPEDKKIVATFEKTIREGAVHAKVTVPFAAIASLFAEVD